MNAEILAAWQQWHSDVSLEVMPTPNLSFERAWQIQQAKINELEAKIKKLEQPDIFWLTDDPENGCDSAEELVGQFIDEDSIGQIVELEVASRLPNINVKILPDDANGRTELEYIKNNSEQ